MALTIARVTNADFTFGNKRSRTRTVTFDSSYATGGEALVASDFGLKHVTEVRPHGPLRNTAGTASIVVSYDHTNGKLLAYQGATEVANTTDLSTYSGRVTAIGD